MPPNMPPPAPPYSGAPPHDQPPPYQLPPPYGQPPPEVMAGPTKTGRVKNIRRFLRDPLSIVLILVIVVALLGAGLIGAELYARKRANAVVAAAAECEVNDKVKVSFGPSPFLLQHLTGHYNDISIHTAGNELRKAKGMKADINISNVDLNGNANTKGTIGTLDATITWTSDGIKETLEEGIPFISGLINTVSTNPSAGTIQLSGAMGLGSVTLKPRIAGNGLSLQVVKLTAMGASVPHESAQVALDAFAAKLTKDYPLGAHAESIQVTNSGVMAHFIARNASIPTEEDPCFAHI
jgi:hypothetical protein